MVHNNSLRDALKKNVTFVTLRGEGLAGQNVTLYKVVFKIHLKPIGLKMGGTPILSHFSPILAKKKL